MRIANKIMAKCFRIKPNDNTAVALDDAEYGESIELLGGTGSDTIVLNEDIQYGHKVALKEIHIGEAILKYGIQIGRATQTINAGDWIHLHNCASEYDTRSSTLELDSGAPTDTMYE